MIKASVIGAAGYGGGELVRFLSMHPQAQIVSLTGHSHAGKNMTEVFGHLRGYVDMTLDELDIDKIKGIAQVVFLALPHGHAVPVAKALSAADIKVIDLSADFRFDDAETYEKWYNVKHEDHVLNQSAVYGLPEIWRHEIKGATVVGNPGCYPTGAILGLYPLLQAGLIDTKSIIIDAKSGVSGAGRALDLGNLFSECNESVKAYKVTNHRHTPEIEQALSKIAAEEIIVNFTPHLIPMTRGILSTIYANLKPEAEGVDIHKLYEEKYANEPFVRVMPKGVWPATKWVFGSNYCDVGLATDPRTNRVIVTSAIDNLVKGAAGQAVQNMNILFGLAETTGLEIAPIYP